MDPVLNDLNRYERKQDEAEAFDAWAETKANEIAADWYNEFVIGGRVDELDWDASEIKFLMAGHSVDALTLLRNTAYNMVQSDPDKYLPEPDYEGML